MVASSDLPTRYAVLLVVETSRGENPPLVSFTGQTDGHGFRLWNSSRTSFFTSEFCHRLTMNRSIVDSQEEKLVVLSSPGLGDQTSKMQRFVVALCWVMLHLIVRVVHLGVRIARTLESYYIYLTHLYKCKELQLKNLRHLALVVDSEEALHTKKVIKLLQWLSAFGVSHITLYDIEGILKKDKEIFLKKLRKSILWEETDDKGSVLDKKEITLEFLSVFDGKEATAKAASFLCSKYLKDSMLTGLEEPVFTESDMDRALKVIGCHGPEPDLLLIYGPARCHLGFPAWRIRYTEIVHMGRLKSMQYDTVVGSWSWNWLVSLSGTY
ncbi:hypothetical protein H6P81_008069 [Aristolochia fimbriata]|uniref:ditrans,polycis-polyprenyl diphosphate synthase [(2E,6E)-farnesyldiphosphate specific] n=1 Tax=Aristolochia fimbriata TaxID=158543 RepID=A0AAV7F201_ARIFI|nr:hypothetical protein H6P81_008069 [Aristolochia fimbriata]